MIKQQMRQLNGIIDVVVFDVDANNYDIASK